MGSYISGSQSHSVGPRLKKKIVGAVDFGGVDGGKRQTLPIILFLQRKKSQLVKSKQLHNNIKNEQKGNKMLFVYFIFVILWLNEIKRFKHEKTQDIYHYKEKH